MLFSKRLKLSILAIKWCEDHSTDQYTIKQDAMGIVTALDALGFLKSEETDANRMPDCTCGETPCICPF